MNAGPAPVVRQSAALIAGLALLVGGGCTTGPTPPTAPTSVPATRPAPSPDSRTEAYSPSPCLVPLPSDWSTALRRGAIDPPPGTQVQVQLVATDGTTFQTTTTGTKHRLEWHRQNDRGVVQDFGPNHPEWQVTGATFDGRYLAYGVGHSYANFFNDFSVYVWDSESTAPPTEFAHGEKDSDGTLMATPLVYPILYQGSVYWTQTRDADPVHTVLSRFDPRTHQTTRLHRGHGFRPVRFDHYLVWADNERPGRTTELTFFDLDSQTLVSPPAALTSVAGPSSLAGDFRTLVYIVGSKRGHQQVWVWRPEWPAPRLLVAAGLNPEFPKVSGDVVVFAQEDAMYAADLRSWSYAKVTPEYGGIDLDRGSHVVVGFNPKSKIQPSKQTIIDTDEIGSLGRAGCQ